MSGLEHAIAFGDGFTCGVLLPMAARGLVVLAAGWIGVLLLRRASAAARHLVWTLAVLALVVQPVAALVEPHWSIAWFSPEPEVSSPIRPAPGATEVAAPGDRRVTPGGLPVIAPSVAAAETPSDAGPENGATGGLVLEGSGLAERSSGGDPSRAAFAAFPIAATTIAVLWAAGVALVLVRLVLGRLHLLRIAREGMLASDEVHAEVAAAARQLGVRLRLRVIECAAVDVPMTWGMLRVVIALPLGFAEWSVERRRAVLLHELAHVKRHDAPVRLLGRFAVALHWFNPLVWWASRHADAESEQASDDVAIVRMPPIDYARSLLDVARALRCDRGAGSLGLAMAATSRLQRRIEAVLNSGLDRSLPGARAKGTGLGVLALAVAALSLVGIGSAAAPLPRSPRGAAQDDSSAERVVVTVARSGKADHRSIQAAIDAAPEGAVVQITPGVYDERLTISKRLTVRGTGSGGTLVTSEHGGRPDADVLRAFEDRFRAATTDVERRAIRAEFEAKHGPRPTVSIKARGVVLVGLELTLRGRGEMGRVGAGAIVEIDGGTAEVTRCAIVGSPASGVVIRGGAEVEVRECLVAGVWSTGIEVAQELNAGRVRIVDSDIRNCRHRGIQIRRGGEIVVDRCRISGSAWHGIRYDHCSPRITRNVILDNERTGIYASGRTRATIEHNLFLRDGATFWYESRDVVRNNTFAGLRGEVYVGKEQAVAVLGTSRPEVRGNVFFDCAVAIYLGNIGGDGAASKSDGTVDARENLFWKTDRIAEWSRPADGGAEVLEVELASDAGNVEADPGLVDPAAANFALAAGGEASTRGAGAVGFAAPTSPWPLQPQEDFVAEEASERLRARSAAEETRSARELARGWIEDVMQIRDRARRNAGVEAMRRALASGNPSVVHAGLIAFNATTAASHDKTSFRELIRPLVETTSGATRVDAFRALIATGVGLGDVDLVLGALSRSPDAELRRAASQLIHDLTDGDITGAPASAVLDLLESEDDTVRREALRGLWGARVSEDIEARLIELAKPVSPARHDAIYFGLSTLREKSSEVLEVLIKALEDPDRNNSGRALWGLGHGVPEKHHARVATALVQLFEARGYASDRADCLRLLGQYGDASHLAAIDGFAANELLGEKLRAKAREAAESIRERER